MRKYQLIVIGVHFFLVFYLIGGLLSSLTPKHEVFPVYCWFLFPLTPNPEIKFALLLHQVGGKTLDSPQYYEKASAIVDDPHSISVYKIVQQLGKAENRNNTSEIERLRLILEKNYIPLSSRYELVAVTYDPVDRWKTGNMLEKSVRTYSTP